MGRERTFLRLRPAVTLLCLVVSFHGSYGTYLQDEYLIIGIHNGGIVKYHLASDTYTTVIASNNVNYLLAFDYDPVEDYLYYGKQPSYIRRIHSDGTGDEPFQPSLRYTNDMSIDPINRVLYYAINLVTMGNSCYTLMKVNLDGTNNSPVMDCNDHQLAQMGNFVLDVSQNYVYFARNSSIERTLLDGSGDMETILSSDRFDQTVAIFAGCPKRIYRTDKFGIHIASVDSGANEIKLINHDNVASWGPGNVNIQGSHIFWNDGFYNAEAMHYEDFVYKADRHTGYDMTIVTAPGFDISHMKPVRITTIPIPY